MTPTLAALLGHGRRHPLELATLLIGLVRSISASLLLVTHSPRLAALTDARATLRAGTLA